MASRYPESAEFDVIHVGNVAKDIVPDDPRGWRLGGGVSFAALTSARLGLRSAAIIGVDTVTRGARELDLLRDAGVAIMLVEVAQSPSFDNAEGPAGRRQVCLAPGVPLPVVAIPPAWAAAPVWLVVPVADETGPAWAAAVPPGARLALAWQGLLRTLVANTPTGRRAPMETALVRRADLISVSRHDLVAGTTLADLTALLRPGAELLVTEGVEGGLLATMTESGSPRTMRYRSLPARQVDPTGAGDVFMAAYVAGSIVNQAAAADPWPVEAVVRWAAAGSAMSVEGLGLEGIPPRAELLARLEHESPDSLIEPVPAGEPAL
jgi:1D-myo-inositol 3-kinase